MMLMLCQTSKNERLLKMLEVEGDFPGMGMGMEKSKVNSRSVFCWYTDSANG